MIKNLRRFISKIKPNFTEGGKFAWLQSTFEAFESFLFVPDETTKRGCQIRDAIDRQTSVIPMQGNGLWGPIWGYLAIAADGKTIVGVAFDHKSETPGLGGEITTEKFQGQFAGKQIMENGSTLPVEFDAITGATKTSDGIKEMIDSTLEKYSAYLKKFAAKGE